MATHSENGSILERVYNIIATDFGYSGRLDSDTKLYGDDVSLDSLEGLELVGYVEDGFGIVIEDNNWREIQTVGQLVDYVESRVPERPQQVI